MKYAVVYFHVDTHEPVDVPPVRDLPEAVAKKIASKAPKGTYGVVCPEVTGYRKPITLADALKTSLEPDRAPDPVSIGASAKAFDNISTAAQSTASQLTKMAKAYLLGAEMYDATSDPVPIVADAIMRELRRQVDVDKFGGCLWGNQDNDLSNVGIDARINLLELARVAIETAETAK
jgi:hypothetical protein